MPAHAILNKVSPANSVAQFVTLVFALLLSAMARAQPIELKLSFFASEHTKIYQAAIKPFVDAINGEGKGLLSIDVYPNGTLGKALAEQPKLVLDGVADIAWVVPGQTPYRFPDNDLLELPGLFHDAREGTLVYTRLVAAKALRGYREFFVIGAFTPNPSLINSRKPVGSLADLKRQKIRANNSTEAEVLAHLGATPTVMPATRLANAIRKGAIDGAALAPTALFDFGVAQVAKNHYLLEGGVAPLVLLMNRQKFDGLPAAAQALIRKYSGEWTAAAWIKSFGGEEAHFLTKIKTDPQRHAVEPSPSDRQAAHKIYRALIEDWAAKNAHNRKLLKTIEADIAAIRSDP